MVEGGKRAIRYGTVMYAYVIAVLRAGLQVMSNVDLMSSYRGKRHR